MKTGGDPSRWGRGSRETEASAPRAQGRGLGLSQHLDELRSEFFPRRKVAADTDSSLSPSRDSPVTPGLLTYTGCELICSGWSPQVYGGLLCSRFQHLTPSPLSPPPISAAELEGSSVSLFVCPPAAPSRPCLCIPFWSKYSLNRGTYKPA